MMRHHYCRVIIMMLITALLSPSHAVLMKRSAAPVPVQSSSTTKKVCGLFVLVAVSLSSHGCIENPNVTFRRDYLTRTTLEERESMQRSITQTLEDIHGSSEICTIGGGHGQECRGVFPPVLNATSSPSTACLLPKGNSYRGFNSKRAELYSENEHGPLPVFRMPPWLYPEIAQIMAFGHGITHPGSRQRSQQGDWTNRVSKCPVFRQWLQNDVVPELARWFDVPPNTFEVVQTGQIWMRGTGALETKEEGEPHVDLLEETKEDGGRQTFGMACPVYGWGTPLTVLPVDTALLARGGARSCPAAIEAGEGTCVPITIPAPLHPARELKGKKARLVVHAVPGTSNSALRRPPIPGTEEVLGAARGPLVRVFVFVGWFVKRVPGSSRPVTANA